MRARSRRRKLRDLWPDVVDNITSGVRAGLALPEALSQLAVRGPVELRAPFAAFAHDYRTSGRFQDSLDRLKDRLSDPVGDRIVESLRIAREVGGSDLGRLLRTLSAFLRDDARTRAELETRQSWTVNAARLAAGAPWVVLGLLAFNGESLSAYSSPAGWGVLGAGAAGCVVAYRLMVSIGRLPDEERVLR
jgi:tight adherence protein B